MDENVAYANAWRYRDYVIKAFNDDKPYDQFVKEQIAGDLLPPAGDAAAIASGLIATGLPRDRPEDAGRGRPGQDGDGHHRRAGRHDRPGFLGLTLGCARCHDHKFDPIPTTDYYGLAGIFKSTKTMENLRWSPCGTSARSALRPSLRPATSTSGKSIADEPRSSAKARETRAAVRKDNREHLGDYLAAGLLGTPHGRLARPCSLRSSIPRCPA